MDGYVLDSSGHWKVGQGSPGHSGIIMTRAWLVHSSNHNIAFKPERVEGGGEEKRRRREGPEIP